jgi:hypothetical protein
MNKIFTFGDGYATGHIWPEWPQILQALLPEYQIVNTAGIGAGAEFLVSGLIDLLPDMRHQQAIVQWPQDNRFDKLLQDQSWDSTISNDSVYHFNRVQDTQKREWWLSSASDSVKLYHKQYVQSLQSQRRLEIFKTLITHTLNDVDCDTVYTSTQDQEVYSKQTKFITTRQNQIQPSPIVHFYWIVEKILPKLTVQVDQSRLQSLEDLINKTNWVPYDPDRDSIWQDKIQAIKQPRP